MMFMSEPTVLQDNNIHYICLMTSLIPLFESTEVPVLTEAGEK